MSSHTHFAVAQSVPLKTGPQKRTPKTQALVSISAWVPWSRATTLFREEGNGECGRGGGQWRVWQGKRERKQDGACSPADLCLASSATEPGIMRDHHKGSIRTVRSERGKQKNFTNSHLPPVGCSPQRCHLPTLLVAHAWASMGPWESCPSVNREPQVADMRLGAVASVHMRTVFAVTEPRLLNWLQSRGPGAAQERCLIQCLAHN